MTIIKKYWWVILLVLAFFGGFMMKWYFTPTGTKDEVSRLKEEIKLISQRHKSDSAKYIRVEDSLKQVIVTMVGNVYAKEKQIAKLKERYNTRKDSILNLNPTEAVRHFSEKTGGESHLTNIGVISPLKSITTANVLFEEREEALAETNQLRTIVSTQDSIITTQNELISIKDKRLAGVTNDYYSIQKINSDLNSVIKQQKRHIRTRNALMGVLSGIAVGAITITLLK